MDLGTYTNILERDKNSSGDSDTAVKAPGFCLRAVIDQEGYAGPTSPLWIKKVDSCCSMPWYFLVSTAVLVLLMVDSRQDSKRCTKKNKNAPSGEGWTTK